MTKRTTSKLLQKTLLAAAALLAAAPAAQAYNLGDWIMVENQSSGWGYSFTGSMNSSYTLTPTLTRAQAGVFQINGAASSWFGNDYGIYFLFIKTGLGDSYMAQSYVANGAGTINAISGNSAAGSHSFLGSSILMPTSTTSLSFNYRFDQTDGDASFSGGFSFSERAVQVAYTKAGWNGDTASGAFAYDNTLALNGGEGGSYGAGYTALNVLPTAYSGSNALVGSVVYNGSLFVASGEGLFAKDGGWLDVRGDLVVNGGLTIRDGEITANTFTGAGNLGTQFESGILSVRNGFNQAMYVQGAQTIGLRDGAVNEANVYIQGSGYSNGQGMFGSLRSIAGTNTQNGFVGLEWAGGEGGGYSVISADAGSTFIINGAVNGVNGPGGANVSYNVGEGAQIVQNGHIGGFINDVNKDSPGDLRLTASNTFIGNVYVNGGTVTVANSLALSASGSTYVNSGALVLDGAAGNLSIAEFVDIQGYGTSSTASGALYNLAGANTLTGTVRLQANSGISTAAGTSLTIAGNLDATDWYALTINDVGATSSLNVTGHTGAIPSITKNGAGTATIATADAALLQANVNAGTLILSGSSSSSGSRFGSFNKNGAATLQLGGSHYFWRFYANEGTTNVVGTLDTSSRTTVSNTAALNVAAGATLNGPVVLWNSATVTVSGTSVGSPAVVTSGVINGNITAHNDSTITLGSYGVINGDVTITDNARFIIQANSIHNGDFNSSASSHITIDGHLTDVGAFASNFLVSGSARLDGHGIIDGNVHQTGGVVAPGNSPGILTVGTYTNNGGLLDLEIANNTGAAGVGYDQLRVTSSAATAIQVSNALSANYSTIQFTDYALGGSPAYVGARGDVFQVIASSTGAARNTYDKFDLASYSSSAPTDRILFDHSTGRAYGTGLTLGTGTFRDYGVTNNQKEIGRALWMESIAYDKHTSFTDENFASTALDPVAAAAQRGYKAWILTTHDAVLGEQATDLGLGAVSVLTAADATLALDALSPEAYVGIADQGARIARGFARLSFAPRNAGTASTVAGWDFDVGYLNDELRSDSSSAYTSYKASSNQYNVSASRALGERLRVTFGVGYDDGRISAEGFRADVNTIGFGAGVTFTPDSKKWHFDLGAGLTTADWKSFRGASLAQADNQQSLSFAGRFSLAPLTKGDFSFTPYVGASYARSRLDAFAEKDVPGSIQLAVDAFSHQSLQSELGTSIDYRIKPTTLVSAVFGWDHEFRNSGATTITSQFVETGVTDTKFSVRANGFGSDLFRAGLSFRHDLTPMSSVRLGYDAIMGSSVSSGRQIHADYSVRF
jgi:autotransporter-associated beta strand protein